MIARLKAMQDSEKGFTLVELLVVIIIIGILAAVAIPAFLNQRQRANDAAVQSDVKNVATQIETALVETPNATTISGESTVGARDLVITVESNILESITLTDGVTVKVSGDNKSYLVNGYHANGKRFNSTTEFLQYNSEKGGLQGTVATTGF